MAILNRKKSTAEEQFRVAAQAQVNALNQQMANCYAQGAQGYGLQGYAAPNTWGGSITTTSGTGYTPYAPTNTITTGTLVFSESDAIRMLNGRPGRALMREGEMALVPSAGANQDWLDRRINEVRVRL